MFFQAEILKDVSYDPYFKVVFKYETDTVSIKGGTAEVLRKAPKSEITFDDITSCKLRDEDKSKLELEILNTVVSYMFSKGTYRTFKGNLIIHTA